jgi:predicted RNA binding protein YcfA (HicA-like mRNA interferase family)
VSRLPPVPAREVLAILLRAGFVVVRVKGSHHFLRHKDDPGRQTVIPLRAGDMPAGTLRAILKQAKLSKTQFLKLR